jgi:hypothetical protein
LARGAADAANDPPTAAWKAAVAAHVPGRGDAALNTVAAIEAGRIPAMIRGEEVAEDRRFLVRALVLHTDLAIVQRAQAQRGRASGRTASAPLGGSSSFMVVDGHATGRRQNAPHWNIALQVADALASLEDVEARRVARHWFRTVNALFLHWAEGSRLYVEAGLRLLPDDAALHLDRGTMHQLYASPRVQRFFDRLDTAAGYPAESPADELRRAEVSLRKALALDPSLWEARIRLAHVTGDLGQPAEAVALVQEALAVPVPPFFQRYATLVLGRNLMRLNRVGDAAEAFDRAVTLAPDAQAPRIGRSQAALAAGRASDALAALTASLTPERALDAEGEDWAQYFRVREPLAAAMLDALRREVP